MLSDKQLVPIFEDIETRPILETTRGLDTRSPCIFDRRTSRTLLRLCVVRYKHGQALLRVSGWRRVCGYLWITEECAESYGIINQTCKKNPHDREGGGLIVCLIISTQRTLFSAKFEMVFTHNPFAV